MLTAGPSGKWTSGLTGSSGTSGTSNTLGSSGPSGPPTGVSGPTGPAEEQTGPSGPGEDLMGVYGPVSTFTLLTTDVVAPGMPVFVSGVQVDNLNVSLVLAMPVMDANGANLTGLAKLTVATAVMTGGVNPFTGLSMTQIVALPGVTKVNVTLTPDDAGQQKTVVLPVVNLGGQQAFAAACSD